MPIFSKIDLGLVERNRQEFICYLMYTVGLVLFILFRINGIVALSKENKDDSDVSSQFSLMVCAGGVVLQAMFLFVMMWNLGNIMPKLAFASLSFEMVTVAISYAVNSDEGYQIFLSFQQTLLHTIVVVGSLYLLMLEDRKKGLNQVEKLRIDNEKLGDRIKLLQGKKTNSELELLESKTENEKLVVKLKETQGSMVDQIKALKEQYKLMEKEKKKLQIDLVKVKRERKDLQKDNDVLKTELDVSKKELEALTIAHSLQVEKLREMEAEAFHIKVAIKVFKEGHESNWEKNIETSATLTYEIERRQKEVNKMEKNCVELRKNFDNMRKNGIAFKGDGEEAFRAAEQALAESIRSVLLYQQQR